jgi:oligopeptide/dipeptide ABC transporter ATP-binding protein
MTGRSDPELPLLRIRGLNIRFGDALRAATVDAVDLDLMRGETVALVGESGSGKSLLAYTIAGILDPAARFSADVLEFSGQNLLAGGGAAWDDLRGRRIAMVFQNARAALNPVRTIGRQIGDVLRAHRVVPRDKVDAAVIAALAAVKIPDPAHRVRAYPGDLSGGMCQRVGLAIALASNPSLLIADEPTTGLDTTTQAAILALVLEHTRARGMATLLITHDLDLARAHAQRIVVMHAGQIVENARTEELFSRPRHPYTALLIGATPASAVRVGDLAAIPGSMPNLSRNVPPCRFADRCVRADGPCRTSRPSWVAMGAHGFACTHPL